MSIFDAYDQEYNVHCQEIRNNISEYRTYNSNPEKSSGLGRQVEAILSQAAELLKQMEVEVRSQDPATRKVLTEKVGQYKKTLSSLRSDYESARDEAEKANLLGSSGSKSAEHRQRMLNTNDRLNKQSEMLANATRTVEETTGTAIEITEELARNREKILSVHDKVRQFSGVTDTARRIISSMSRREVRQRFLIAFVAVVLIVAIIIVIYFTMIKKSN